jgi:hypothetical protein
VKRLVAVLILLLVAGAYLTYLSTADTARERAEEVGKQEALPLLEKALAAIQAKDRGKFRAVTHFTADIEALKIEILHKVIAENFPDRFRLANLSGSRLSDLESSYHSQMIAQSGPQVGTISFNVIDGKITALEINLANDAPIAATTPEP